MSSLYLTPLCSPSQVSPLIYRDRIRYSKGSRKKVFFKWPGRGVRGKGRPTKRKELFLWLFRSLAVKYRSKESQAKQFMWSLCLCVCGRPVQPGLASDRQFVFGSKGAGDVVILSRLVLQPSHF